MTRVLCMVIEDDVHSLGSHTHTYIHQNHDQLNVRELFTSIWGLIGTSTKGLCSHMCVCKACSLWYESICVIKDYFFSLYCLVEVLALQTLFFSH